MRAETSIGMERIDVIVLGLVRLSEFHDLEILRGRYCLLTLKQHLLHVLAWKGYADIFFHGVAGKNGR